MLDVRLIGDSEARCAVVIRAKRVKIQFSAINGYSSSEREKLFDKILNFVYIAGLKCQIRKGPKIAESGDW